MQVGSSTLVSVVRPDGEACGGFSVELRYSSPEQRSKFYGDVEALLVPGFLHHTVRIQGIRLGVRSLGPGDLFMLRARADGATDREWQSWMVASSIWMVDGYSTLGDSHAVPRIKAMVSTLPRNTLSILFTTVLGLFARVNRANEAIEAYIYENTSRSKWKMLGGQSFGAHSGIPGAEHLGTNFVQRIWMAFNEAEDLKHQEDQAWEGFKLVAATNSPKGVKKLDAKDVQSRRDELGRRQAVMDRYYYYRIGLVDREGYLKDRDKNSMGARVLSTKSVDDLEDEMRRWVAGEMDDHDKVVATYKAHVTALQEQELKEREARRLALRQAQQEQEEVGVVPQGLIAYSPAQLQAILRERNPGKSGARWVGEGHPGGKQTELYEKYLSKKETAGRLARGQQGTLVDPEANPDADQRTLNDIISQRDVAFHSDERGDR